MKRTVVAILSVLVLQSAYAQAQEPIFSLKNNSNHKINVSFYIKGSTAPLTLLDTFVEPGGEKTSFNSNYKNVEKMVIRYCDGPDDTSCECVEDKNLNKVCEYKHVYFTVEFTPAKTADRTYHLKFDMEGGTHSRGSGRPMVKAQKGTVFSKIAQ
jgi:hypothetical protein